MSAPDFSRGYLRLPHGVWEVVFCRGALSRRQLQLVAVILRQSWGWHNRRGEPYTWTRPLTQTQLAAATGLDAAYVCRELHVLLNRGVLQQNGRRYHVNADPALWISPKARAPEEHDAGRKEQRKVAEAAAPTSGAKTAKILKRNVVAPGDIFAGAAHDRDRSADARFLAVVLGFTGPLHAADEAGLRRWVAAEGKDTVWQSLAPAWRGGPAGVRAVLRQHVRDGPESASAVRR